MPRSTTAAKKTKARFLIRVNFYGQTGESPKWERKYLATSFIKTSTVRLTLLLVIKVLGEQEWLFGHGHPKPWSART